jgi:hypothetical protein
VGLGAASALAPSGDGGDVTRGHPSAIVVGPGCGHVVLVVEHNLWRVRAPADESVRVLVGRPEVARCPPLARRTWFLHSTSHTPSGQGLNMVASRQHRRVASRTTAWSASG